MLDPQRTLASLVLEYAECAPVFHRHRIDYCCRGNMSIALASERAGIETSALLDELASAIAERKASDRGDVRSLPTIGLIAHIVSRHHAYLRKTLPFVQTLSGKVSCVHGGHEPRLRELDLLVNDLADTLVLHLDEEETILFPSLMAKSVDHVFVAGELAAMQADHLILADLLERIRTMTEDLKLPQWACNSYRTLFSELARIDFDIHRHVHLENHVLLPRFVQGHDQGRPIAGSQSERPPAA